MNKQIVTVKCTNGEVMIHYPSGRIEFMTFWQAIKLCWYCTRKGVEMEVIDD